MTRYKVTYIVTLPDDADPSSILDGALTAKSDLVECIEGEARVEPVKIDDGDISVEPAPV
jgi:hypothetical protein